MKNSKVSSSVFSKGLRNYLLLCLLIILIAAATWFIAAVYCARTYPDETAEISEEVFLSSTENEVSVPAETIFPQNSPTLTATPEASLMPEDTFEKTACPQETVDRLSEFTELFINNYYSYFGLRDSNYYYWELCNFTLEGSDLRDRMDQALTDRGWINTYANQLVDGKITDAWQLTDGSYEIIYSVEVIEYSEYWTADENVDLHIFLIEAPDSYYGFLVTETN